MVETKSAADVLHQIGGDVMNEVGEDVSRRLRALLRQLTEDALFPLVEGATGGTESLRNVGHLLGDGILVNPFTGCLQWLDALLTVPGCQLHSMNQTVGVFEKLW